MAIQNFIHRVRIHSLLFEELHDAGKILGSPSLQANRHQVFGAHYPRPNPFYFSSHSIAKASSSNAFRGVKN